MYRELRSRFHEFYFTHSACKELDDKKIITNEAGYVQLVGASFKIVTFFFNVNCIGQSFSLKHSFRERLLRL